MKIEEKGTMSSLSLNLWKILFFQSKLYNSFSFKLKEKRKESRKSASSRKIISRFIYTYKSSAFSARFL